MLSVYGFRPCGFCCKGSISWGARVIGLGFVLRRGLVHIPCICALPKAFLGAPQFMLQCLDDLSEAGSFRFATCESIRLFRLQDTRALGV